MATQNIGPAKEAISITPCIIYEKNSIPFPFDLELASAFALIEYSRKKSEFLNSKYIFFSKALWPVTYIQFDAQNYIAIDNLDYFSFSFKISSSPNRAKIGRLLRDAADRMRLPDVLDQILVVIEEKYQEEIKIKGMIDPDVLRGLTTLIKLTDNQPYTFMAKLEEAFSTDDVINITESFKNAMKKVEGNIISWKQIKNLVTSTTDDWIIEINREYTDKEKRAKYTLSKLDSDLQDKKEDFEEKKSHEYYQLQEWKIKQNRSISKNMLEKFMPIVQKLEKFLADSNVISKNLTEEPDPEEILSLALKLIKNIENDIPSFKELVSKAKVEIQNAQKDIDALASEIRTQEIDIEKKFEKLVEEKTSRIPKVKEERDKELSELKQIKDKIEGKTKLLLEKIDKIIKVCENEKSYLGSWSVSGNALGMVMPINKVWIPLYVAEIETTEGDEKIIISPPSLLPTHFTTAERWVPFDFLHTSFKVMLKERLENALEINLELRSNFEFNCSKENLFSNLDIDKKISRGFNELLRKNLIDEIHINEIRKNWSNSLIK
ncbi:MAG: coiled-coil domain-containing protein [Promethearchaeota archaeon]